jgi:hypothetical protein
MGSNNSFRQSMFLHEEQEERRKESLELVHSWRTNSRAYWSILKHIWSLRLKRRVVRPKE